VIYVLGYVAANLLFCCHRVNSENCNACVNMQLLQLSECGLLTTYSVQLQGTAVDFAVQIKYQALLFQFIKSLQVQVQCSKVTVSITFKIKVICEGKCIRHIIPYFLIIQL
jgi:hypothetical protein